MQDADVQPIEAGPCLLGQRCWDLTSQSMTFPSFCLSGEGLCCWRRFLDPVAGVHFWVLESCFAPSVSMRKSSEDVMLVSTVHFGKLRQFLLTFILYSEFLSIRISDIIIIY